MFRHLLDTMRFDNPADHPSVYCDEEHVIAHPFFLASGAVVCSACFEDLYIKVS